MPTYDYRCSTCTTTFEFVQSIRDDKLTLCPVEGGPQACIAAGQGDVKRVFSAPGITFKGDGFYKTDHGSRSKSDSDSKISTSSSDSKSKSDSSSSTSSSSSSSSSSTPAVATASSSSSSD